MAENNTLENTGIEVLEPVQDKVVNGTEQIDGETYNTEHLEVTP